ncbi:MAG: nucleotidyltransferase domain-containing protein [Candidatus Bipolaricaulota bacterium]
MPTRSLARALFPQSRIAILAALVAAGDDGLHLREVARRADLNSKTAMRELHALRDAGILVSRPIGRQVVYRLNPDCPIADELRSIVRKTAGLAGVLAAALAPFAGRIDEAYVYGSHARGEERADSDVDLMVVGSVSLLELSPVLRDAGRTLRRTINPTLYTLNEYSEARAVTDSFVDRVAQGPRLNVAGGAA